MSTRRLPLISLCAFTCLFASANIAFAQHEPASGGGMIGGGSTSTGRHTSTKPTLKPANKPSSTTTTPAKPRTTTTPVRKPTTSSSATAESYYQQGEALYNQNKYKEALDF